MLSHQDASRSVVREGARRGATIRSGVQATHGAQIGNSFPLHHACVCVLQVHGC